MWSTFCALVLADKMILIKVFVVDYFLPGALCIFSLQLHAYKKKDGTLFQWTVHQKAANGDICGTWMENYGKLSEGFFFYLKNSL